MSNYPGLTAGVPIVTATGAPTPQFITYMQQVTSGIANSSGASMPTPAPVTLYADYTGAYLSGQLPRTIAVQRFLNGDDVSTRTRWFLTTVSGSITATIDQTGVITITAMDTNSVLQIQSNRDGVTLTCNVSVNKVVGSPPSSGSGGATVSTSYFYTTNDSTTDVPITDPITVTVGSSGTVALNAPLDVTTNEGLPTGTFNIFGKWQWYNGTSWVDVAAEVEGSPVVETFETKGSYGVSDGSLTVNQMKTGLTSGSFAQFRLAARGGSSAHTLIYNGTASAIPQ